MDAADSCSVSVGPIRNDSYLIRNVRNCTYRILRARKIRGQIFITVKHSCADGRSVMVGNGTKLKAFIRICPYLNVSFRNQAFVADRYCFIRVVSLGCGLYRLHTFRYNLHPLNSTCPPNIVNTSFLVS